MITLRGNTEMRMTICFVALAAMGGCAVAPQQPITWYKDGASQRDFDQAAAQCEYEVSAATQGTDPTLRTVFGQELDRAQRQRDLGIKCLRAKGFRQMP
jgi:hypothetical protein